VTKFLRAATFFVTALAAAGPAAAGGFTPELFDAWIKMRAGDGKPVYWYAEGRVLSNPEGALIGLMQGVDTSIVMRDPDAPATWVQLSRKIFWTVDPATGTVALDREGKPRRPIAYPYQVKTYTLDGDDIVYTVESHDGGVVSKMGPHRNYTATRLGNVTHFNYAMFIDRVRGDGSRSQRFEVNDFFLRDEPGLSDRERFQYTWVGTGPGPIVSSALSWRYGSFDDMPSELVKLEIRKNAPLWLAPPKDMAEIERLRGQVPYQISAR
jgi:hypothetical protein